MADSVDKWTKGFETSPGVPSVGYDYTDFYWNTGSGDSHAELTSEKIAIHHDEVNIIANIGAVALDGAMTIRLIGSNDPDLAVSKWDVVKGASTTESGIDEMQFALQLSFGGGPVTGDYPRYLHYKVQLDPNADPGADVVVRVGIVPGKY